MQTAPGVYDDALLDGLDYLMAELGRRNMTAVLYLNNSWEWSGGYTQYLAWARGDKAPVPSIDGWPAYMAYAEEFIRSDEAQRLFDDHVRFILSRTNRYVPERHTRTIRPYSRGRSATSPAHSPTPTKRLSPGGSNARRV